MKKLQPDENELIGEWLGKGAEVHGNEACDRIEWLISGVLHQIGVDEKSGGWDKLYRDPVDSRFWLLYYPKSYMHGGGPPSLKNLRLTESEVKDKFVPLEEWERRMEKFRQERNIRPFPESPEERK